MKLRLTPKDIYNICDENYHGLIITANVLQKEKHGIDFQIEQKEVQIKHRYQIASWRQCFFGQSHKISHITRTESKSNRFEREFEKYKIAKSQFIERLPELLKTDRGKYAAIAEGHLEIGDNKQALRNLMIRKYGYVSMYLAKIDSEKRRIRMPPRVRSK